MPDPGAATTRPMPSAPSARFSLVIKQPVRLTIFILIP